MIFDIFGIPRENGATDLQDSARLAGLMEVFGWPKNKINLLQYIDMSGDKWKYVRHPLEAKYDMSRDQAVCLMAGLKAQKRERFVDLDCVVGKDIFPPSVRGHVRRCQGGKASWFQNQCLKLDILWAAYVKPDAEINQLLCMLMIAGDEWIFWFTEHHKTWRENLREYWCGWRGEPDLCFWIISRIDLIVFRCRARGLVKDAIYGKRTQNIVMDNLRALTPNRFVKYEYLEAELVKARMSADMYNAYEAQRAKVEEI